MANAQFRHNAKWAAVWAVDVLFLAWALPTFFWALLCVYEEPFSYATLWRDLRTDYVWVFLLLTALVFSMMHSAMLAPVQKKSPKLATRAGMTTGYVTVSVCCTALLAWAVFAFIEALREHDHWVVQYTDLFFDRIEKWSVATVAGVLCVVCGACTLVQIARFRPQPRDALIRKLSLQLVGVAVVSAFLVFLPLEVVTRFGGDDVPDTIFGFLFVGLTLLVAAGPLVMLPLFKKERAAWWAGRCDMCRYDLAGIDASAGCPECGYGAPSNVAKTAALNESTQ